MKKMIFGGLLFIVGMYGVTSLLVSVVGTEYGWSRGWVDSIIMNEALGPFILFGIMSFIGLVFCIREAFRKDNR
jgi:hypothetical protein